MKAHIKRLNRAAKRIDHLNELIDGGDFAARRVKKQANDHWTKRKSNNVAGFYDQKKARDMKRGAA